MRILAIETSCDETAIAIAEFSNGRGLTPIKQPSRIRADTNLRKSALSSAKIRVLANLISSQVKIHQKFGGVVPNLAKREHQKNLVPLLLKALKEGKLHKLKSNPSTGSGIIIPRAKSRGNLNLILEREPELLFRFKKHIAPLPAPKIDAIAVTHGPGLAPALWVGVNFARALSALWNVPLLPTDHMAGHLYSALIPKSLPPKTYPLKPIKFPALALLVSGGHTELVLMRGHGKFKIIGETRDDAAGEAFDKVARLLGLPYPGGPEIARIARGIKDSSSTSSGNISRAESREYKNYKVILPRPMLHSHDYDFSFSGLKTAVLYMLREMKPADIRRLRPAIAKEFQDAVVDVLVKKTVRAVKEYKAKTVLLGGGVAANHLLQQKLREALRKEVHNSYFLIPNSSLTGDNALMIALAAYFTGNPPAGGKPWKKLEAHPNLTINSRR